ncbi:helix-turn-helix transcriptional regulator [Pseudofrankia sp. DC12]|uniref:helix-turn-helix domain-containing protein n=1 Tax=Pseudofrankia sp. DC12 TaxID=683315 RepID=UPI000AD29ACB|nr:helix-turn-helix transcriptional regulator [Pseudofrankia sp. DC12]
MTMRARPLSAASPPVSPLSGLPLPLVTRTSPARSNGPGSRQGGSAALAAPRPTAAQLRAQAAALRVLGWTYRRIAAHWQRAYRLNARLAFRLAHGWTQDEAARQWNARWPDDPKSGKAFSYWESWPARGGRAPSPDTLGRLAELYLCRPGDLLDGVDYAAFDPVAHGPAEPLGRSRAVAGAPRAGRTAGTVGTAPGRVRGCPPDPDFELDLGLGFGQEFWHPDEDAGRLACSGASRLVSQYSRRSL